MTNSKMIPIYDAIEFVKIMGGGSTKPWQILANVNGTAVPFVMKLYDRKYQKEEVIMREIIASVLALEFEIGSTESAFIRITREFIKTLRNSEYESQLQASGSKTKFASKLAEPVVVYSGSNPSKVIDKFDKANIYAFDNMILHRDRRIIKPNILLGDSSYYLIDNESCLVMPEYAKSVLQANNFDYLYRQHLLLGELKKLRDKDFIFDTFESYLQGVANFNSIAFVPDLLNELNHPCSNFYVIRDYLESVKQLSSRFVNHLRISIS